MKLVFHYSNFMGQILVVVLMFIFKHSSYARTDPWSISDRRCPM